jgi:hypothetical protein
MMNASLLGISMMHFLTISGALTVYYFKWNATVACPADRLLLLYCSNGILYTLQTIYKLTVNTSPSLVSLCSRAGEWSGMNLQKKVNRTALRYMVAAVVVITPKADP